MADSSFARKIMPFVDRLLPDGEVRIETLRPNLDGLTNVAHDVRITHVPSGEVAECAKHKSQFENKIEAMLELRLRLDGM